MSGLGAWALVVALLAPPCGARRGAPAPPTACPRTLADALRDIDAFAPGVDRSLTPPPPPARVGARTLVLSGIALIGAGIAGMVISPGCATRDARGRCVDAAGSDDLFPALIVLGIGATTTGAFWMRRDLPETP